MSRTRPRVGDVVEIEVPGGLGYAQYTHAHAQYGALLRVLPGVHPARPKRLADLVAGPHRFQTFFPLHAACARGIVRVVGVFPIPASGVEFPLFRAGVVDPSTGKVGANWWLWDGEREWRVGALTARQLAMPIRGVVNDTLLVERIVSNWRAEEVT